MWVSINKSLLLKALRMKMACHAIFVLILIRWITCLVFSLHLSLDAEVCSNVIENFIREYCIYVIRTICLLSNSSHVPPFSLKLMTLLIQLPCLHTTYICMYTNNLQSHLVCYNMSVYGWSLDIEKPIRMLSISHALLVSILISITLPLYSWFDYSVFSFP